MNTLLMCVPFWPLIKVIYFYCAVYNPRIQNTVCLVYESFSHAVITTLSLYNHRCTSAKSEWTEPTYREWKWPNSEMTGNIENRIHLIDNLMSYPFAARSWISNATRRQDKLSGISSGVIVWFQWRYVERCRAM